MALVEQPDSGRRAVNIQVLIFTKRYNLRKSMFFDHISAKNKRFLHYNMRKSAFLATFPQKILHTSKKSTIFAAEILNSMLLC